MSSKWFVLSALSAMVALHASPLSAAPKIQVEKEILDFGKITGGLPINTVFSYKNVGDSELEILNVRSGCGCTKAEAKSTRLAPGESSTLEAVFNSTGFSGRISKSISLTTNDPERQLVILSIQGQVVPVAEIKPSILNFGSVKVGQTIMQKLTLVPTDPKTFAVVKVESQGKRVSVPEFKKVETPQGVVWELSVRVTGGEAPGRVLERVSILTNADKNIKLSASVYGNVVE